MIRVARENAGATPAISLLEMDVEALDFPEATLNVVRTRHAPVCVPEINRALKPGRFFANQQVGARDRGNIRQAFGTGSDIQYDLECHALIEEFASYGCQIVATGEYDVA